MPRKKKGMRKPFNPGYRDDYWQTGAYNQALFQAMRDDILSVALSRFKWVNLPETCDARFLEWTLVHEGCATIAFPKGHSEMILSLRAVMSGEQNMYDMPIKWRAMGVTGKTDFKCDWSNGVFLYENSTRYPLMSKINIWAKELASIIRTKQVNRFHQQMPVIISGASEHQFDMQNILKQISQGEPAVITTNGVDNIDVHVWNTGVEFIGEELTEEWQNTWNIIYKELGISNVPYSSDRRIKSEVETYTDQSQLAAMSPLDVRRTAAEKFCNRFAEILPQGPFYPVWNSDNITDNYNLVHRYDTLLGDVKGNGE